eukprot:c11372_g1_i1 orf=1112-3862(+)
MDGCTDYFHHLPDEVVQLIFSCITDCKTLVQCMSVSKAFRQHAVCVPSLSIICPGSFSSYDERLHRIYAMVKAFKNLQSLIVRVGQPKEEPPSWARCMRYAEIGGSVEKFMFMAAKCGDFSELDAILLGLEDVGDKIPGKVLCNGSGSITLLETNAHTDVDRQDANTTRNTSIGMGEVDSRNTEAWSDIESDEEGGQRGLPKSSDHPSLNAGSEHGQQEKRSVYSRLTPSDASFLLEPGQRKPLSQFNLRQVIAPSNDVLKRMLPVIHFAIVQGLNELRDSLPAFVAQFAELRTFLLVDMVESITVFMREHHIQELKSFYLQDWDGMPNQVKGAPIVEPYFSGLETAVREDQSGRIVREERGVGVKMDSGHSESSDSRRVNCTLMTEEVAYCGGNDKQLGDMPSTAHSIKVEAQQSKDLAISVNKDGCLRRKSAVLQRSSTSMLLTCNLPVLQGFSTKSSDACKGKEKLSEYQDVDFQGEGRLPVSNSSGADSRCNGCSNRMSAGSSLGGCATSLEEVKGELMTTNSVQASEAGSRNEASDGEKFQTYTPAGETLLEPCTRFGPFKMLDDTLSHTKESGQSSQSVLELNNKKGTNHLPQPSHVEGLNGRSDWQDEDHFKAREDGYRLQGIRYTRDAKVDLTNKHLLKRCHKSDTLKKKDFCKSLRLSAGMRGVGSLFSNDSVEDVDVQRSQIVTCEDALDKNEQVSKDELASAGSAHDDSLEASCSSGVVCAEHEGVTCAGPMSTDGGGTSNREGVSIEGLQQNEQQTRSEESIKESRILRSESHENVGERSINPDGWRHAWQERVRRLRDSLRVVPGQELEQTHEDRRERSRDPLRKIHRAMEKDALSFDYTFWRAEQVSSCNYVMSDISMCIATHAARPLVDAEKKVLTQAAIAGPLLVATVSHVNENYNCHNL